MGRHRNSKAWLGLGLRGMAMGAADLVPGVSGGTVAFIAGIYEELLFRLIMIPIAIGILHLIGLKPKPKIIFAVLLTSLLFSLAHYRFDIAIGGFRIMTHGDSFRLSSFVFRWIAGIVFAVLFLKRGFGITCGTHAAYDMYTIFV